MSNRRNTWFYALLIAMTSAAAALVIASRLGLSPAEGHTGFDRVVVGEEASMDTSYFAHYLHHKYFEVNYSDGMVPLDKWFGSFHDGTPEADAAMKARRLRRGV